MAHGKIPAFAGRYLGKAFSALATFEGWFRAVAGTVFILAGIFCCLAHIYGLPLRG